MTPDVLVAAAGPRAEFTVIQTWLIAIGSGIALVVAFGTLPMATKRRRMLSLPERFGIGLLTASSCALGALLMSVREPDPVVVLHLYTVAMLTMVILRVVFAGWLRRIAQARLAGTPFTYSNTKVAVVALVSIGGVMASLAVFLSWLPTLLSS